MYSRKKYAVYQLEQQTPGDAGESSWDQDDPHRGGRGRRSTHGAQHRNSVGHVVARALLEGGAPLFRRCGLF